MEPAIHVITLAVSDLERALAFYRDGLGLDSAGVIGREREGAQQVGCGEGRAGGRRSALM